MTLLMPVGAGGGGAEVKIGTYTVSADTAAFAISGIPGSDYSKLLVDFIIQPPTLGAVGYKYIGCYINGDMVDANYTSRTESAEASGASSVAQLVINGNEIGCLSDANNATHNKGTFGSMSILQRPMVSGKPITIDSTLFWTYASSAAWLSRETNNITKLTDATGYVSSLTFAVKGASPPAWIKAGSQITIYGIK